MLTLSQCVAVMGSLECEYKGFVVHENMKCMTLEKNIESA